MAEIASQSDAPGKNRGSNSFSSERTATGASESSLWADTASGGGGGPGPIHHHPQNQQPSVLDLQLPHQRGRGGSSSLSLSQSALGGPGIRAGSLCAKVRAGRRRLYRSGVSHARNMSCACATVVSVSPGGRCGTCLPSSVITSASTLTGLTSVCNVLAHRSR